ncbi:MAG: general secretion pathway protein GspK [Comamonadaceae bacterium CG_4_9_14_3_um_filter_60_33]|nr:MAG: general secretion pathway protein GspK [Comamonadaceae bacterium CG2_30_59_20]PIY30113.1 MAG: general secretion pathway protein GspK [Comamonadaceae bacterium CG_4_10_14_3_um_filter_60_42]PJB46606.1 MAG: general secretion pathway protein GspK [Comamonadaceae bacterium CG_4_9_14_3_um_filter_60_33]
MRAQRGAAILTAMLTVVLVATLASAMLWQQWRGVEVESAQRTRVQSAWILTGALDWARLILREDARQGGPDHLAEPWAVALAPARLTTFLAAQQGQALVGDDDSSAQDAFLAGSMQDLQARLNVTNLLDNGKLHEPSVVAWERLFGQLNLPGNELTTFTQQLLLAHAPSLDAQNTAIAPLRPQSVSDLVWLGLSPATLQALRPFVTLLPARTPVNLNTATPEVLMASLDNMDMAQARALVGARDLQHLKTLPDAEKRIGDSEIKLNAGLHAVATRFFSVTGQLRVGQTMLQETSVLQRDGMKVKILSRTREVVQSREPLIQ